MPGDGLGETGETGADDEHVAIEVVGNRSPCLYYFLPISRGAIIVSRMPPHIRRRYPVRVIRAQAMILEDAIYKRSTCVANYEKFWTLENRVLCMARIMKALNMREQLFVCFSLRDHGV